MIEDAEKRGIIKKDATLIEVSSGNTGIALAAIALTKGYKMRVIIAKNASSERITLLKALGADIIFVEPEEWRDKAVKIGKELAKKNGWIMLNQYENEANVRAHHITGKEIINQLKAERVVPDIFVAGIGTGGTITGIATVLKKEYPNIKVIGILPEDRMEGLRGFEEFKPPILDLSLIDEIIKVKELDAKEAMKELVKNHGLLVGISSGAAFYLSKKLSEKGGKKIVTLFPDGLDKYLSYI